ncbi:iron-containing alcohol dehydrogenase, partial [Spongiibacter marinus]|uniref:iron-containing alcohol dehydrogenase n=1 Tax=Spongiibacter marinus TaxID=354246 RepID=UPI0035BE6662
LLDSLFTALDAQQMSYHLFDAVFPNPTEALVQQGYAAYQDAQCDYIIAFGGGSPIDTAKAIKILTANPGPSTAYSGVGKVINAGVPLVAINTAFLLLSSITYGFALLQMQQNKLQGTLLWLALTGVLGTAFLSVELYEFYHLIHQGAGPQRSAFLTAFFALVGTHGLHVTIGVIWLVTLLLQLSKHGLTLTNRRRVFCLSMFWHFLDVIWIGVFTFVYLMGSMS